MKILDLYITDICNLNCEYCYVDVVKKEEKSFNREDFTERINLLSYDSIKFLGGEPLIKWQDIKAIISSLTEKKSDINFTIITNGILLDKEKVSFIKSHENVEVLISLHEGALLSIRKKKDLLLSLEGRLSFYIIFDPKDFSKSLEKFLEFSRYGYKSFCFAPEIYALWDEKNLLSLKKILQTISPFIIRNNIVIGGIAKNFLKVMNYGCEKYVYGKLGDYQTCNRARGLKENPDFSYKQAYDYFHSHIGYKDDPNRWFYVCPVGWYLDNKKTLHESIKGYKELNTIFLDFHRFINGNELNFLHKGIEELRFNLTAQCNIRCNYCYVDFKNESLPFATATNIVDFILEQDGKEKVFSFFGGEPLLEFQLLQKIVAYIDKRKGELGKQVSYKIATNFMLVTDEVVEFLKTYNFEIHISMNGDRITNDEMRDNSSTLLHNKLLKYKKDISGLRVVILLAFGPQQITSLNQSITYIYELGYKNINFEMVFGKSVLWKKVDILLAVKHIYDSYKEKRDLCIENIKKEKNVFLDIDTKGRCNDNSLEFYGTQIDTQNKKHFDELLSKIN